MAAVTELVLSIGARPVVLDAERHDRLMTWVSHLPHAVASSLVAGRGRGGRTDLAALAGPGLLDTTRLAGQPVALALELALADPEALAGAIDAVRDELGAARRGAARRRRETPSRASSRRPPRRDAISRPVQLRRRPCG